MIYLFNKIYILYIQNIPDVFIYVFIYIYWCLGNRSQDVCVFSLVPFNSISIYPVQFDNSIQFDHCIQFDDWTQYTGRHQREPAPAQPRRGAPPEVTDLDLLRNWIEPSIVNSVESNKYININKYNKYGFHSQQRLYTKYTKYVKYTKKYKLQSIQK